GGRGGADVRGGRPRPQRTAGRARIGRGPPRTAVCGERPSGTEQERSNEGAEMTFELSPSLIRPVTPGVKAVDAYELKFHLRAASAAWVEGWARQRLMADPHGPGGEYWTTTTYCDTPGRDVYH